MSFRTTTLRLAGTYLAIIMVMSLGFSLVFYQTSAAQLERQRPPSEAGREQEFHFTDHAVNRFLERRAAEARQELIAQLVLVNLAALAIGSVVSYLLAEHTLRPICANMHAQTQFVSDASHELRTPLTALRTANEVALRNPKLTLAEARTVIEANVTDATRLQTLANTMLGLLRHDHSTVQLQPVALQTVVSEAMNLVVAPAQAKSIAIDDTTPPLIVRAHQQRLVQLLTILLDNAIKYSPEHTTITITAESTNRWARVQIIDQGIGMDTATQRQIFQRFYRADQARTGGLDQGYGLGLAIAQQIITEHGGKITVDSTPGSGTTFTVSLRLAGRQST